jgi:hypothetical protein
LEILLLVFFSSPPAYFIKLNETQQIQIQITKVSGSIINITVTKHFLNGTKNVNEGYVDIATGVIEAPYGFLIMRSKVSENQQVYPSGGHQTISGTSIRSYLSGQRETNSYITQTDSGKMQMNVDKLKGIAVDYFYQTQETSEGYTTTIKETLTNTNAEVWSVNPEFPSTALLMLLLIAIPIVLVAYKKRTIKPQICNNAQTINPSF